MLSLSPRGHVVRHGETLADIARLHGHDDWHRLYAAPYNKMLRLRRTNPHELQAGDIIFVPPRRAQVLNVLERCRGDLARLLDASIGTLDNLESAVESCRRAATLFGASDNRLGTLISELARSANRGDEHVCASARQLQTPHSELARFALAVTDEPQSSSLDGRRAFSKQTGDALTWAFGRSALWQWRQLQTESYWRSLFSLTHGQSFSAPAIVGWHGGWTLASARIGALRRRLVERVGARIAATEAVAAHFISPRLFERQLVAMVLGGDHDHSERAGERPAQSQRRITTRRSRRRPTRRPRK